MDESPTFGSLFAGIGGIDLGLERAGWRCVWQVENDPYCQGVLGRHWPSVQRFGEIRETHGSVAHAHAGRLGRADITDEINGSILPSGPESRAFVGPCGSCLSKVNLIAGGFPCQPVSTAGKGQAQKDPRWLWPEMARIVREVRPNIVLVENVPGLRTANHGSAFGEVLGDLAAFGYDAEWESIPAAALGAPHLRYRVFIVAHSTGERERRIPEGRPQEGWQEETHDRRNRTWPLADSEDDGRDARGTGDTPQVQGRRELSGGGIQSSSLADGVRQRFGETRERQGPPCVFGSADDTPGRSDWWAVEPDVGRVAHGVPARVDRLRVLGNAVVPQVAEWIGKRLLEEMKG